MKKLTLVALVATYFLSIQAAYADERAEITFRKPNGVVLKTHRALPRGIESVRAKCLTVAGEFTDFLASNVGWLEVSYLGRLEVRVSNDGSNTPRVDTF